MYLHLSTEEMKVVSVALQEKLRCILDRQKELLDEKNEFDAYEYNNLDYRYRVINGIVGELEDSYNKN